MLGGAGARGDAHVVGQAWRVAAGEVDQPFIEVEAPLQLHCRRGQFELGVAAGDDAPVHSTQQLELRRRELQLRVRCLPEVGTALKANRAAAGLGFEALDAGVRALQFDVDLAVGHVHAFYEVAHADLRASNLPGVFGRAQAPADHRAGLQAAGQAPARRHPGAPGAEVRDTRLDHALDRRVGVGQESRRGDARRHRARSFAEGLAGQRLRETPHTVFREQRQAQVGELQGLGSRFVADAEVAIGAAQNDVGVEGGGAANQHLPADAQITAPAQPRLGARQQRRDGNRFDLGLDVELRRGRGCRGAHGQLLPTQCGAEQLAPAGLGLDASRRACVAGLHGQCHVLQAQQRCCALRVAAHIEGAQRALPARRRAFADGRQPAARVELQQRRWPGQFVRGAFAEQKIGPGRRRGVQCGANFNRMGARRALQIELHALRLLPLPARVDQAEVQLERRIGRQVEAPARLRARHACLGEAQAVGLQFALAA